MGQFSFDIARGREVELYGRVNANDPANSALKIVVLAASGLDHDSILRTYATLAAILAANTEVTNSGYGRITLTDADLDVYTVDTETHEITLPLPPQTYTAVGAAGGVWSKALVCYDNDTTSGTDADIVPVTAQDIRMNNAPVPPDGGNIVFSWPTGLLVA